MNNNPAPLAHLLHHARIGPTVAIPLHCLPQHHEQEAWYTQFAVHPKPNPFQPRNTTSQEVIHFSHKAGGWLYLPRFKGMHLLGLGVGTNCNHLPIEQQPPTTKWDCRSLGVELTPITATFAGHLKTDTPPQVLATSRVMHQLHHESGGAMLVLPCGFGKTVCALWVVAQLRRKALVLVHTGALADQWAERIATFLPFARVGRMQQDTVQVEGCDVVVGMIQSVVTREYPKHVMAQFGTLVVDEAHHIAAPWFGRALQKLPAQYVLGLSATPDRKDGLGHVLPWVLGNVAFQAERPRTDNVHIDVVQYDVSSAQKECVDRHGRPQIAKMITNLTEHKHRNALLVNTIRQLASQQRNVLVLSQRRQQLEILEQALVNNRHHPQQHQQLFHSLPVPPPPPPPCVKRRQRKRRRKTDKADDGEGGGEEVGNEEPQQAVEETSATVCYVARVVGGTPKRMRERAFQRANILLSTYAYAAEGIDIARLDTLVQASPGVNIEQTTGRILRPCEAKKQPIVVDIHDMFSLFVPMGQKRHRFYKHQNYTIVTKQIK